jgi:tetratricopeptide (TPR) repeat protein
MKRDIRFWIFAVVFQVVFGLTVFSATRYHYMDAPSASTATSNPNPPPKFEWGNSNAGAARSAAPVARISTITDPVELERVANEYFTSKQYDQAAQAYERLLTFGPNVNTYNNMGITLFYLGRSDEALLILNEGIAFDSTYQRIWLTLGYVNSQIGDIEEARKALNTAVGMGVDGDVGRSAQNMLDSLPG